MHVFYRAKFQMISSSVQKNSLENAKMSKSNNFWSFFLILADLATNWGNLEKPLNVSQMLYSMHTF